MDSKKCPFCGHDKIRVIEEIMDIKDHILHGHPFMYCYCGICGCNGPTAWNIHKDPKKDYNNAVERWNERECGYYEASPDDGR